MLDKEPVDIIVIGAGIAGASVASELAKHADVLLVEMESSPGYHTTGRSAAIYAPSYGPKPIRALTRASKPFFDRPSLNFSSQPLLTKRELLLLGSHSQKQTLDVTMSEIGAECNLVALNADETLARCPYLRSDYVYGSLQDLSCSEIDVAALHHGYLVALKREGGTLVTNARVSSLGYKSGLWSVVAGRAKYQAPIIVNAAGAWCDVIGGLASAESIGLQPKRRTAMTVVAPRGVDVSDWPLIIDSQEKFYLKPESGRLLISPANEDLEEPCDVQPDYLDIAICIDRIERAFDLSIDRPISKWAGLRSFVKDKVPVSDFSQKVDGFYWLAGQGGYGIQTAPALARYSAAKILNNDIPVDILDAGLESESLGIARLEVE